MNPNPPTKRQTEMDAWLSPLQASQILGVTTARIRQMALEGQVLFAQTPMGRMFNRAEIEGLAAARNARKEAQAAA